jgi:hypothetical protein
LARADFDLETETCGAAELESYGFVRDGAAVSALSVGDSEVDHLTLWFAPPDAEVTYEDQYVGDALITLSNGEEETVSYQILVSYLTAHISLVSQDEEE